MFFFSKKRFSASSSALCVPARIAQTQKEAVTRAGKKSRDNAAQMATQRQNGL
jgi:hypothetical protein